VWSGSGRAHGLARARRPARGSRCRAIADASDALPVTLLRSPGCALPHSAWYEGPIPGVKLPFKIYGSVMNCCLDFALAFLQSHTNIQRQH